MALWVYEMVRWGPQMDRSVYGRVLLAYEKVLLAHAMVLGATPGLVFLERLYRFLAGRPQVLLRPTVRTEVDCFTGELCAAVRAKVSSFIGKRRAAVGAELLFFGTLLSQCSVPSSVPRHTFLASGIYPRPSMLRRPTASAFLVSEKTRGC